MTLESQLCDSVYLAASTLMGAFHILQAVITGHCQGGFPSKSPHISQSPLLALLPALPAGREKQDAFLLIYGWQN